MRLFRSLASISFPLLVVLLSPISVASQEERGMVTVPARGTPLDGRGKLWAVIIGVSNYKNLRSNEQLRFAHRDAEALAAFLRSPNGGGFHPANMKLLLNQNATLAAVRTALGTWLPRSAEPDDVVYIFFAGHGVVEGDRDGYLLAYDSDPQNLYATALSVAELDSIVVGRVRARNIILIADACHAGRLGWASRGGSEATLINSYLDEIEKSGAGLLRLLASRADQRSFEDERWGGGHGAFTHFLLEGLRGKADQDKDNFVRTAELLDYLARVVPAETQALQHPRGAGNIDPRLPLSVLISAAAPAAGSLQVELRGFPGTDVYIDKVYRGRIRPDGVLIVEKLTNGSHELSVDTPGAGTQTRRISLSSPRTLIDLKPAATLPPAPIRISQVVPQIRQALGKGLVLEPGGAWPLYLQLLAESPSEPQRASIEVDLSNALEEIGQKAINTYVGAPLWQLSPDAFHRAARAYNFLKRLSSPTPQLEAKRLFCEGRALIAEGRHKDAIPLLQQAVALDPKSAYSFNALGVAYEGEKREDEASESFKRASKLAPNWPLPRMHIGIQYFNRGRFEKAEDEFKTAIEIHPRDAFSRLMLVRTYRERRRLEDAEREALEVIRLAPDFPPPYAEIGLIYEARKQYAKAADAFFTALRLAPDSKDSGAIRERAEWNRRMASGKRPSLKKP